MRAASASTRITDPYRAGVVLGESLAELQPEVVFLFSSIHEAVPELLSGFYDGLEHDSETQMVIVNKKNPNDKRVINKSTFDFLKHDFDVVPNIPKELKNK